MRTVRLHPAAAQEAVEAAAWYELQQSGLGAEFSSAVQAALDLLEGEAFPLLPMPGVAARRGAMRLMLKRFPFAIVVVDQGDEILVLAVAHHSRRPGYWRDRRSASEVQDAAA
jgi:toxin ParE1/3/4